MLVAVIVFGIRLAVGAPRRVLLVVWIAVAAFLFVRAESITAWIAAAFVALVLATVLVMRTARRPGDQRGAGDRYRCAALTTPKTES